MTSNEKPPDYDSCKFSASGNLVSNNDQLVQMLDDLEICIEDVRRKATELDTVRANITRKLTRLDSGLESTPLSLGHREELNANITRLMNRILTVTINVEVPRNPEQRKAFDMVQKLLKELKSCASVHFDEYTKKLQSYMNACDSDATGPVDSRFQQFLLSCAIDDQKSVKKQLKHWLEVFQELRTTWDEKTSS